MSKDKLGLDTAETMMRVGGDTVELVFLVPAEDQAKLIEAYREGKAGNKRLVFVEPAVAAVIEELARAQKLYGPMRSAHEGHSIIAEEFLELQAEVFKKPRDRDSGALREEASQLAAMALRFVIDVVDGKIYDQ